MAGVIKSSTGRRFRGLILALLLATAAFAAGTLLLSHPQEARSANPPVKLGVHLSTPAEIGSFESLIGRQTEVFLHYAAIHDPFDPDYLGPVAAQGRLLFISWEPWNRNAGTANQPAYRLRNITRGDFDADIRRWARDLRDFRYPVLLRPMSEMNGNWTSWGGYTNGNSPADFAPAWRHIRDIFEQEGATNIIWVWSPNRDGSTADAARTFDLFYPGGDVVDYIGFCGYNWGTMYNTPSWISSWQSFDQVFGDSYAAAVARTDKPIIISETSSTESGGNKGQWITDAFSSLGSRYPRVKIVTWFNIIKETDWRVNSSGGSLQAFRTAMLNLGPADLSTNQASLCPRPALRVDKADAYWASLSDYQMRRLSVDFQLTNFGVVDAYDAEVTGSEESNSVHLLSQLPVPVGDIGAGGGAHYVLRYSVPSGVISFFAWNHFQAVNGCGNQFSY